MNHESKLQGEDSQGKKNIPEKSAIRSLRDLMSITGLTIGLGLAGIIALEKSDVGVEVVNKIKSLFMPDEKSVEEAKNILLEISKEGERLSIGLDELDYEEPQNVAQQLTKKRRRYEKILLLVDYIANYEAYLELYDPHHTKEQTKKFMLETGVREEIINAGDMEKIIKNLSLQERKNFQVITEKKLGILIAKLDACAIKARSM